LIAFLAVMSSLGYLIVGLAVVKVTDVLFPDYTREYRSREPEVGTLVLISLFWPYAVFMIIMFAFVKAYGYLLKKVVGE
jgi:hypothetical protein